MKPIRLIATQDTPRIVLDAEANRLEIYGNSFPEDTSKFYSPIIDWFKEYVKHPNEETTLYIKINHFNMASIKKIQTILSYLNLLSKSFCNVNVSWHYNHNDKDVEELGEALSEAQNVPFDLIPHTINQW